MPERSALLGVDLGGTRVRVGRISNKKLERIESALINARGSEEEVLSQISGLISAFDIGSVAGIGVGAPSVVDVEKGIVYDTVNIPSWKEVHLREKLQRRFGVPVRVNNDANCFALGERAFGKGRGFRNMVGLIVGTGLGAGILFDNRLCIGANCGAGEFGMVAYRDSNYEHYCSGQFFTGVKGIAGEELFERAVRGDRAAMEIFEEFGRHLGEAVKMIMYTVDPEIIVLGGSVSRALRFFQEPVWEALDDFAYPQSIKKLRIEASELEHVGVLGAAALFYEADEL